MTRDEELGRRSRRSLAQLSPPAMAEAVYQTEAKARRAALRAALTNTELGAIQTTHGWVGVVYIRSDQAWMTRIIREHGCRAVEKT